MVWFDTTEGNEMGEWMEHAFGDPPAQEPKPVTPGIPPAHSRGIALGNEEIIVGWSVGPGTNGSESDEGPAPGFTVSRVRLRDSERKTQQLYHHPDYPMNVVDLSPDESLVAIQDSEGGNPDKPGVRVLGVLCGLGLT